MYRLQTQHDCRSESKVLALYSFWQVYFVLTTSSIASHFILEWMASHHVRHAGVQKPEF